MITIILKIVCINYWKECFHPRWKTNKKKKKREETFYFRPIPIDEIRELNFTKRPSSNSKKLLSEGRIDLEQSSRFFRAFERGTRN